MEKNTIAEKPQNCPLINYPLEVSMIVSALQYKNKSYI